MIENIRLSFQGIWSHKMRSFLTMLGIIIGIAAIIAIVSTIKGTNERIKENIIGAGTNTVDINLFQGENECVFDEYTATPEGIQVLDDSYKEEILKNDLVESVSFYNQREIYDSTVYYQNTAFTGGKVLGIDSSYFDTCSYNFKSGRGFSENDYKKYRKVAILDSAVAATLFKSEDPIGKTIEIKSEPYVIIGVVEKSGKFKPEINTIEDYEEYMSDTSGGTIYIPDATWPVCFAYDEPKLVVIKASKTDDMSKAGKYVANYLNSKVITDEKLEMKYKAEDLMEKAQKQQELKEQTSNQLLWIASISLLVGGIGVMNIMLVSVTERTREIGLKKAIGAPKTKILAQFLTEAAVLTSIGGLLGVIAGIVLAQLISKFADVPVAISIPAAVGSVIFSMLIGLVFGILPSYKAANLNPIDALRYE